VPKCLGAELSGHFGTSAEVSWYRSVLGPKCPVTCRSCPVTSTCQELNVAIPLAPCWEFLTVAFGKMQECGCGSGKMQDTSVVLWVSRVGTFWVTVTQVNVRVRVNNCN